MAAMITRFDMSAECCRTAYFNALHYLVLLTGDYVFLSVPVAILREDIGELRRSAIIFHFSPPAAHSLDQVDF
jgi:hypothetical protein